MRAGSFERCCWLAFVVSGALFAQGTISSVTPNSTPAYSPATAVTISGSNFASPSSIVFTPPNGPATTISPTQIQAAQIAATIPANLLSTAGTAQIAIQNGSGALSNQIPFTITAPIATSVTPNSAIAHSKPVAVTIAGSNIVSTAVVSFTGPTGSTLTVTPTQVQAAQIAATIPAALLSTAGTAQIGIQNGPGALSNRLPFTIGPSVAIKAATFTAVSVGKAYSQTLTAAGGTAPYTWSLFSGALPPGLGLSSDGTISGVPTTPGPAAFSIQVTDASGAVATAGELLTVEAAGVTVTSTSFPSGILNFQFPQQVLTASGGAAPYTFAVTTGSLPAGLTLANGIISGTPTASGTSTFTITATDSAGAKGSASLSLVIRGAGTDLLLLSGGVSFSLNTGASALPVPQSVSVQSTDVSQTLQYTTVVSSAPWLSVTSDGVTPGTVLLSLTPAALSLNAGTNNATVTLTCTSTACATKSQTLAVTLVVSSPPAQLNVATTPLTFHVSASGAPAQSQNLTIQNAGSGTLNITSITCGLPWCSVGSFPSTLSAGPGTQVVITVDPSKLPTGADYTLKPNYLTTVQITSSAGSASVPVILSVSAKPYLSLSQSGNQLNIQAGSSTPGNPPGSFLVNASGGTANWTAAVQPGADWLTVVTPSGTASDAQPGGVVYSINSAAASLAAGTYFGNIVVDSTNASSAALSFIVILNVTPATQPPTLAVSPGALIFVTNAGANPA
ncbi:MAG TPA: Ig domain-containing protein, partial [Bryobacteraceae bacterium]|nr:Ig domain-containing protein [Bryobacteraceae bacterium]